MDQILEDLHLLNLDFSNASEKRWGVFEELFAKHDLKLFVQQEDFEIERKKLLFHAAHCFIVQWDTLSLLKYSFLDREDFEFL